MTAFTVQVKSGARKLGLWIESSSLKNPVRELERRVGLLTHEFLLVDWLS